MMMPNHTTHSLIVALFISIWAICPTQLSNKCGYKWMYVGLPNHSWPHFHYEIWFILACYSVLVTYIFVSWTEFLITLHAEMIRCCWVLTLITSLAVARLLGICAFVRQRKPDYAFYFVRFTGNKDCTVGFIIHRWAAIIKVAITERFFIKYIPVLRNSILGLWISRSYYDTGITISPMGS